MRSQAALVALAGVCLAAPSAWPQAVPLPSSPVARTYYIRGSVRNNEDSRPLEMVKVDLKRPGGDLINSAFTLSNGEFEFARLPNGMYIVEVDVKGYETARETVEIINAPRSGLMIFLHKPIEFARRPVNATVSARELSIPGKARNEFEKGTERLYGKRDYRGSLQHFERAIEKYPGYYEAYEQIGVAHQFLGEPELAEQAFHKSIELSQDHYAEAEFRLASLLSTQNRFPEAEKAARRGLELDGDAWQGHYELARALSGLGKAVDAETSALETRSRKPDFAPLYLVLANIHIRQRNYRALLDDLNTYLKLEPDGPSSEQARQTREKLKQYLTAAPKSPAPPEF